MGQGRWISDIAACDIVSRHLDFFSFCIWFVRLVSFLAFFADVFLKTVLAQSLQFGLVTLVV